MVAPDLTVFRALAESSMPDLCTITRPATTGTLNTGTGAWTPDSAASVYSGACHVQQPTTVEQTVMFGEVNVTVQRVVVRVPWDAGPFQVDDRLVVTDSTDADLLDQEFRVVGIAYSSWQVVRKLYVEEAVE